MIYRVSIYIELQEGVLDIQGKAVERSLASLGYDALRSVKVGKYIQVWVESETEEGARKEAEKMCDDLLVNGVIEQFRIELSHKRVPCAGSRGTDSSTSDFGHELHLSEEQ